MSKMIIDRFYELTDYTLMDEDDNGLTIQVVFDITKYSDFQDYCSNNILNKQKMTLEYLDNVFCFVIVGCSFTLGVISYNEQGEVESVDTTAIGILDFKK